MKRAVASAHEEGLVKGIRRWAGSALAGMFAVLVVLALVPVRAGAAAGALSLEPQEGPPGTSVAWTVEGFADCPPVDDADSDGVVVLRWDGKEELGRARVSDDGSASSTFLVPEKAALEVHPVTVTCLADDALSATSEFDVTPPVVVQVVVPNVLGSLEDEARSTLEAKKFPVRVTGDGEVVVRQDPKGGTAVDPGTEVTIELGVIPPDTTTVPSLGGKTLKAAEKAIEDADLVLGGVSGDPTGRVTDQSPGPGGEVAKETAVSIRLAGDDEELVPVPDLVGRALDDVPGLLVEGELTLGLVTGTDPQGSDQVVSQQPPAGTEVAPNSKVNVSVDGDPPELVAVPDVVGDDAADARAALEALGLLPAGSEESDGKVTEQQPPAGTLVPMASAVSLVLQEQQSSGPSLLAGLVAVGAVALAARGPLTRSLDRRWVRTHLDLRPGTRAREAAAAEPEATAAGRTRVVRAVPRYDPDTHVLHEEEP